MNSANSYAELRGNLSLSSHSPEASDGPDLRNSELSGGALFASAVGSMNELVGMVLLARCPAEVAGVYASLVALATRMGGFMERCRLLPMRQCAHCGIG